MERLTEKHYLAEDHYMKCSEDCNVDMDCVDCPAFDKIIERLAAYEATGLMPEEIKAPFTEDTMINLAAQAMGVEPSRLREIAEAEKDRRVVVLPCKRGDELWTYGNFPHGREVYRFTVSDVSTLNGRTVLNTLGFGTIRPEDIGKTVFLTREEAEKALRGMDGKNDS